MLDSGELQTVYEYKCGTHLTQLQNKYGRKIYCKKIGYNFLSVSPTIPPVYSAKDNKIISPILTELSFEKKYYEAILLLFSGKLYLAKWLSYGDDFNVTANEFLSFSFTFEKLSKEDSEILHDCYVNYEKKLPKSLQFKLNCGKMLERTTLQCYGMSQTEAILYS